MPQITCPDCDEPVTLPTGGKSARCPACGTKIVPKASSHEPADNDDDDLEEPEEKRERKRPKKKKAGKSKRRSEPLKGLIPLVVFGPICLALMVWAPFSGIGTALAMLFGALIGTVAVIVVGIALHRDPDWHDEISNLLVRLIPILGLVVMIRATAAEPRRFAAWMILSAVGFATMGMGITAQTVWKTMKEGPANHGGPAPAGQPSPNAPGPNAQPLKESDDEIIIKAIAQLDSKEAWDQRQGLDSLTKAKPNAKRAEVVQRLVKMLDSDDGTIRSGALKALGFWGGPEEIPILTKVLDDKRAGMRDEAEVALGRLRAPVALPLLVDRLGFDHTIKPIVAAYGDAAEDAILAYSDSTTERKWFNDSGWYMAAMDILGQIGTQKSIPVLQKYARSPDADQAQRANRALTAIQNRLKQ